MKRVWKEALLAWATANLLFFRRWAQLLPGPQDYFLMSPRPAAAYLSLMGLILVIALAAWGALFLARKSGRAWLMATIRVLFVAAASLGLYGVLHEAWVFFGSPEGAWLVLLGAFIPLAGFGYLQWHHKGWHRRIVPVAVFAMIVLAPLAPILFAQGIYHAVRDAEDSPAWDAKAGVVARDDPPQQRVVWIVFDEFDQRLAFDERPADVHLPELDRLREEGFSATNAYTPSHRTLYSIPMMTTGRLVDSVSPQSADRILLRFEDARQPTSWSDAQTVFHSINEQGKDVAITGTYHPYCRLFKEQVTECSFFEYKSMDDAGLGPHLDEHLDGLIATVPTPQLRAKLTLWAAQFTRVIELRQHSAILNHEALIPQAMEIAARDDLDFVYIHMLAPHLAGVSGEGYGYWDPETNDYNAGREATYYDNLALTDRIIGQIRNAMIETDTWNKTTFVVTSDHGYRADWWGRSRAGEPYAQLLDQRTDHRVPFLVKPANHDPQPLQYDEPFNLYLMKPFIETALAGNLTTAPGIAAWFDEQPPSGPREDYEMR